MRYFTYQGNDYDCGFASLKMLLCYAHKTPKYLRLAKPEEKRSRYSYRDLLDIAARHGVGEQEVDQLLREHVLVDLYPIVRQALRVGSYVAVSDPTCELQERGPPSSSLRTLARLRCCSVIRHRWGCPLGWHNPTVGGSR